MNYQTYLAEKLSKGHFCFWGDFGHNKKVQFLLKKATSQVAEL